MVFSPNSITQEHILNAVEKIENERLALIPSTKYEVIINEKRYPPKEILRYAHEQFNGEKMWKYRGGRNTNQILERLGFKIVAKTPEESPILKLIEDYKILLKETRLNDEIYKWELIQKYRGRPNLDADDLYKELKSINYFNLMFHTAKAVSLHIAKEKPDEYRRQLKELFDENIPLGERVNNFINGTLQIYRELNDTYGTHHDERTISAFLTFFDPTKYTFFKDSFYKKYCSVIGVTPQKKDNKYTHYLELIDDLINEHLIEDEELLKLVEEILPADVFDDKNHLILAQDFLYQSFDKTTLNYWIFQCNPNDFDFEAAIKNEVVDNWTVKAHKDKIKPKDKVIIWQTGKKSGCYALAEVTSEPHFVEQSSDDEFWKTDNQSNFVCDIKITHNLINNPILSEQIRKAKGFENFKGGTQGTNFTSSQEEYNLILNMINHSPEKRFWLYAPGENARFWDEFYENGIMAIGWEELGDLNNYQTQQEIADKLDEIENETKNRPNDSLANFQFANDIAVGDIIFSKKGRNEIIGYGVVSSDYYFDESRQFFNSCRKVDWKKKGSWIEKEGNLVLKTLTDITKYPTSIPGYKNYVDRILHLIDFYEKADESSEKVTMNVPLNQILYGPPGTGKTYNTIEKAVEIINGKSAGSHEENKKTFDELRKKGQIEFVTFHQNYSYEDFVVGIFPDVSAGNLRFDKKEGIFKKISDKAKQNWLASKDEREINLDFDFVFNKFFAQLFEEEITEVEIPMRRQDHTFKITSIDLDNGRIKFTKKSGGTGHDLLIKNVKAIYEGTLDYGLEGLGVYYYPLVDELKNFAGTLKAFGQKEELKNFVLIIDEINRANISKVFGELITLLEEDKRLGEINELKVTLPNGETDFGVPPNLYVIGTMNTADKSIALIDIALRRRFEFVGFYPNYNVIESDAAELLQAINTAIFERKKSADYLIGHAYFMQNKSIENILEYKILPLLMEYFAGKTDIVSGLFSDTDWKISYNPTTYDWTIQNR